MKYKYHVFILLLLLLGAFYVSGNEWKIRWEVDGDFYVHVDYPHSYSDADVKAYVTGTRIPFFKKEIPVQRMGNVNTNQVGVYTIYYVTEYKGAQSYTKRSIYVQDRTPPVIILESKPDTYTLPGHAYEEEGFTATDNYDGTITDRVKSTAHDGIVTYEVYDSSGNYATVNRTIVYDDRTPPVITLEGEVYLEEGEPFEDVFSASDDALGDVTDRVIVEGSVDTTRPGIYTLTYTVQDDYQNETTVNRTVTVKPKPVVFRKQETNKTVYLTFDDGPSAYTARLLDILKEYNAKATFFVIRQADQYMPLIQRASEEGHAIGAHAYSHDYSAIYASSQAFWEDNAKIAALIQEYTGVYPSLMRFPGGSSNTVSRFNPGIMTQLASEAASHGYTYFDWNVSSGDAGETTESKVVKENIIQGIQNHDISIVLCHDVKEYTVDAMKEVLDWGTKNGYQFLALTEGSTTAHHPIQN